MTPDELYKTILRTITKVRDVHVERLVSDHQMKVRGMSPSERAKFSLDDRLLSGPPATDQVLDEMARNAAQALIGLVDFSVSDGGMCPLCGAEWIKPSTVIDIEPSTTEKGPGT